MFTAINITPPVRYIPAFDPTGEYAGIKAAVFDGMPRNGRKTAVFAYIGIPEQATALQRVPGIVLLHGGGGHAFLQWVKMWRDRGYAAIAIDNTGYFPMERDAADDRWSYGIPESLNDGTYTNAPDNDGMSSSAGRVEDMWMYHAVSQAILAGNFLRSLPEVEGGKVGITGISWGGVITSIAIGEDNRFAFAVPVYGSGYLGEALSWMKDNFASPATRALWSAEDKFDKVGMPVLWQCWNDDSCFSVNSVSKSYLDTVKNNPRTRICMRNEMMHSHVHGWLPPESMLFADSVVCGGEQLTCLAKQPSGRDISLPINNYDGASVTALLYYINEKMTYSIHEKYGYSATFMDQQWQTAPLEVNGGTVSGRVPDGASGYYIELRAAKDGREYVTTSVFTEL